MISSRFKKNLLAVVCAGAASISHADYTNVYVFGDSLSDNGNLQAFTGDPSIPERFTNGPVAVELVAAQLGFALTPSLHLTGSVYGNNFATAGAIAIDEDGDPATPDINLPTQVGAYLQSRGGQAEADALHIVMIGGNDLFAAQDLYAELVWLGYRDAFERVDAAVESVKQQLQTLVATGAQNILVVNAPDIAETPQTDLKLEALLNPDTRTFKDIIAAWALGNGAKLSSKYTAAYNQGLAQAVADVEAASGIDIKEFDLSATFEYILDNATSLGYTNKDDACVYALSGQGFHPVCNFDTFVFFDEIHPTAVTHERAAAALLQVAQD